MVKPMLADMEQGVCMLQICVRVIGYERHGTICVRAKLALRPLCRHYVPCDLTKNLYRKETNNCSPFAKHLPKNIP